MTLGVLMFNSDTNIVVCNGRFIEMYGLSSDIVKPGCALRDLLNHRKEAGYFVGDARKCHADIVNTIKLGKTEAHFSTTTDGRTIHIVTQPMTDGGWVVTHEDVPRYKLAEARIAH